MQLDGYKVIHLNDIESKKEIKAIINILKRNQSILLLINSAGGIVKLGFKLCRAIKKNGRVSGIVTGSCDSMAIMVLQSCEIRLMLPRSTMFFHPFGQMVEIEGYDLAFVKTCKDKILDEQFYYEKEIAKRARISKKEIENCVGTKQNFPHLKRSKWD